MRDKRTICRAQAFGAGLSVAGVFACVDDFQVYGTFGVSLPKENGRCYF